MIRVRFHRLALRELFAAARKCDRERPGRGARLLDEVDGTILRIARAPHQGSPYLFGTRRFVLQRFPYSTVYITMSDLGHVLAVAHHRRKPGYWRRRLRDA